jgi:hypothetical protein
MKIKNAIKPEALLRDSELLGERIIKILFIAKKDSGGGRTELV